MGDIRNSDGYRKNTSKDGLRSPHINERTARKIDLIARHQGLNFTRMCERILDEYANDYLNKLDLVERDELMKMMWADV